MINVIMANHNHGSAVDVSKLRREFKQQMCIRDRKKGNSSQVQ